MHGTQDRWDTAYEWKAVTLLGLGFGLVGLDRWIIAPLFPFIQKDLGLSYQDIGNLVGGLGILWGVFAVISGRLSDKIGHRRILISSILLFSLLSGFSGLAGGFASLLAIRGLMGVMEGSFCPTSFSATASASMPKRRGFNQGLQQSGFSLFGFGLAPIIATQLLSIVPSWRWVFWAVAIPGFVIGILLFVVLREPEAVKKDSLARNHDPGDWGGDLRRILASRNIVLGMLGLLCAMSCVFVLGGMLPNYLIDYLHLTPAEMGFVTSGMGFGGFTGGFALPGLSDLIGRKPAVVLTFLGAAVGVWLFGRQGSNPSVLFAFMCVTSFFALGCLALITGPISTESAPAGLSASSIGLVVGAGEIFGGGVAPVIGGYIAQHFGIQNILLMPLAGVMLGALIMLGLRETAPRRIGKPEIAVAEVA